MIKWRFNDISALIPFSLVLPYLQKLPRFIRSNPRSSILLTVEMLIFSQFLVAVFFYRQVLSSIIIFLAFKRSDDKRQMASLLRKFYLNLDAVHFRCEQKNCRKTTQPFGANFWGFSKWLESIENVSVSAKSEISEKYYMVRFSGRLTWQFPVFSDRPEVRNMTMHVLYTPRSFIQIDPRVSEILLLTAKINLETIRIQNSFFAQTENCTLIFSTINIPIVTNHIRYRKSFASPWIRIVWNNTLSNKLLKRSQIWSSGEFKSLVLAAHKNHDGLIECIQSRTVIDCDLFFMVLFYHFIHDAILWTDSY